VGIIEASFFAYHPRQEFRLRDMAEPRLEAFYKEYPGDFRVLDLRMNSNRIEALGQYGIWGYDPVVLRRYAEFIAFTQGSKHVPCGSGDNPEFNYMHPLLSILRCRFMAPARETGQGLIEMDPPLPHFLLLNDCRVITDPQGIWTAMSDPAFDPRHTVLLESAPDPAPVPSTEAGKVDLAESSTDHFVLDIDTPSPSVLLMTDVYAKGWRARPLIKGPQQEYHVQPGDHTLCAIPLAAGRHRLQVEYAPWAFRAGRAVSLVTLVVFLAAVAYCVRRHANSNPRFSR
jgi:hypothetical protein